MMSHAMPIKELNSRFRFEYTKDILYETEVLKNPFSQFEIWFRDMMAIDKKAPNAMTLSTADARGRPSSRIVLLKHLDKEGFVFFTNYRSKKGQNLAENPYASLLFYAIELERQIIIEGKVETISYEESNAYFKSRPLESQLAAISSHQSDVVPSRESLELAYDDVKKTYVSNRPECPDYWGGYRLIPDRFEFWQGRESRLHDRVLYQQSASGQGWTIKRLSP